MAIRNYKDLEVWQKGRLLVKQVYVLTHYFPKEEQYGLSSQLRRAAVSIPSNIAEGHSRSGTKDFIQFISIAIGSLAEVETQIILAEDLEFVSNVQTISLYKMIDELQRMLHGLRSALKEKI